MALDHDSAWDDGSLDPEVDAIVDAVAAAHRRLAQVARTSLAATSPQINNGEFQVLRLLVAEGDMRTSDLSVSLSMPPSTLTRYCDNLVRHDLATRRRDVRDRREVRVAANPDGERLVAEMRARQHEGLVGLLAALDPTDRTDLLRVLSLLVDRGDWEAASPRSLPAS